MKQFGKRILKFDSVASTFDKLSEYGAENGLTVVAKEQTQGVGRSGRQWQSEDGGLYFSFYVIPDTNAENTPFLAIVCALAAQKALNEYTKCLIKWPNDIVTEGKKICGILTKSSICHSRVNYVMAGVGINVNNTVFSQELKDRATSLKCILNKEIDVYKILEEFFEYFEDIYLNYTQEKIINEYKAVCVTLNSEVALHYADGSVVIGKCVNIRADGTIDVETPAGIVNVNSGEVSVRGIYGYV